MAAFFIFLLKGQLSQASQLSLQLNACLAQLVISVLIKGHAHLALLAKAGTTDLEGCVQQVVQLRSSLITIN